MTHETFTPLVRIGTVCLLPIVCLAAGFRAAGSVVRERERRTLDGLLVLPVTRERILGAKWLGSVLRMRHLLYGLGALWLVGVCIGALHPGALVLLVLTAAAHVSFVASLGVWVSVTARNTLRANFMMAAFLLLFFGGSCLLWISAGAPSAKNLDPIESLFQIGLNPWRSWWSSALPLLPPANLEQREAERTALLISAAGAVVFALPAAGFWQLAVILLRREQGTRA